MFWFGLVVCTIGKGLHAGIGDGVRRRIVNVTEAELGCVSCNSKPGLVPDPVDKNQKKEEICSFVGGNKNSGGISLLQSRKAERYFNN